MSLWLLVRDSEEVDLAYSQAKEMLTWARRNGALSGSANIDGIWVNADLASLPPEELSGRDPSGNNIRFRIHETSGPAGFWLLCRIEPMQPGEVANRAGIIEAILAANEELSSLQVERSVPVLSTLVVPSGKKSSASAPSLTLVKK